MSATNHPVHITHLYPKEMNIYGDNGNVLALQWRLQQRSFAPVIHHVGVGDDLPSQTDIIVCGGGQDSGQGQVQNDLQSKAQTLQAMRDDGVVMLAVCGMYQLLGHYFETGEGRKISGAGVLNITTLAGPERLIGNIILNTQYGQLVGFENHSGETTLGAGTLPLGVVQKGAGNSQAGKFEGAITHNVFGTYLHGPILPKNPQFADELIVRSVNRRYAVTKLEHIDDRLAALAATIHASRPR